MSLLIWRPDFAALPLPSTRDSDLRNPRSVLGREHSSEPALGTSHRTNLFLRARDEGI